VNRALHYDYTTVGHVTIDVMDDGSRRAGGTALYAALQAARLGLRALIITQGVAGEIEELIEPFRGELELEILPAERTTTLRTTGSGSTRTQRVLAWAGPITVDLALDTSILHLAPVTRECPTRWRGTPEFVALTPQGLARQWTEPDGEISLTRPADTAERLAERCDALVVSEHEHASCAALISRATAAGAVVAVTDGPHPNTILLPHRGSVAVEVPGIATPRDDLGAGDVFAAAFFVALEQGGSPQDAAGFATAAAAVRMQGAGAGAIGDRAAIDARLNYVTRTPR
jgi:sugar/nucleoside kinase (ribokinase family)